VFATIEQSLVIRQLGALDPTDKASLRQVTIARTQVAQPGNI
jgi:hypothetical protein